MNIATRFLGRATLTALLLIGAEGAGAQDPKPIRYSCTDGTKLQAMFSPAGTADRSVRLIYAGSKGEVRLPQALSADGSRYAQRDVEFWIKGQRATLTRAGQSTTCRTSD